MRKKNKTKQLQQRENNKQNTRPICFKCSQMFPTLWLKANLGKELILFEKLKIKASSSLKMLSFSRHFEVKTAKRAFLVMDIIQAV